MKYFQINHTRAVPTVRDLWVSLINKIEKNEGC